MPFEVDLGYRQDFSVTIHNWAADAKILDLLFRVLSASALSSLDMPPARSNARLRPLMSTAIRNDVEHCGGPAWTQRGAGIGVCGSPFYQGIEFIC